MALETFVHCLISLRNMKTLTVTVALQSSHLLKDCHCEIFHRIYLFFFFLNFLPNLLENCSQRYLWFILSNGGSVLKLLINKKYAAL